MSKVERYINEDGKVGVLISGGFGAGWFVIKQNTLVRLNTNAFVAQMDRATAF